MSQTPNLPTQANRLDECDRQIGVPASRACRSSVPLLSPREGAAPGWLASFAADPMAALREGIERFVGTAAQDEAL